MVFLLFSFCRPQKNEKTHDPKNGTKTHKNDGEILEIPWKFLGLSAQLGRSEAKFRSAARCHPILLGTRCWQLPRRLP